MTWTIQAITGELEGQKILIERDMLVGRHQTADIILQSAEISRKHAAFLLKEDALWIQDLGSSNGTFVNDVQITAETLLKNGDILQFASLQFTVLEPVAQVATSSFRSAIELQPVTEAKASEVEHVEAQVTPAPVVDEIVKEVVKEEAPKTAAEQMNEQGMPALTERDATVQLSKEGMPQGVAIPKPAPIPEGVDLTAVKPEPKPIPVEQPITRVEQEKEVQKNASIGLITVVVLIIVAIIAWLLFK
jgi:pSer/pThr/pTyr-binding forkhead associated (FHA) protein